MQVPLLDEVSKDEEVIAMDSLESNQHSDGLTSDQAREALERFGYNELQEEDVNPIMVRRLFFAQAVRRPSTIHLH